MIIRSASKLERVGQIQASKEHPFMCCADCGRTTDKIIQKHSDYLRKDPNPNNIQGQLTMKKIVMKQAWKRCVKPSDTRTTTYNGKECKQKVLYFSYFMLPCMEKKHKITIRKAPFSTKLVSQLV